jgi:hypothetical protein
MDRSGKPSTAPVLAITSGCQQSAPEDLIFSFYCL